MPKASMYCVALTSFERASMSKNFWRRPEMSVSKRLKQGRKLASYEASGSGPLGVSRAKWLDLGSKSVNSGLQGVTNSTEGLQFNLAFRRPHMS